MRCTRVACVKVLQPPAAKNSTQYHADRISGGEVTSLKRTEFYDGYTDDYGVFKEGPPVALRLEYIRSKHHGTRMNAAGKFLWSPFDVQHRDKMFSPFFNDTQHFGGRDYYGHRKGFVPGAEGRRSIYEIRKDPKVALKISDCSHGQSRVPKWLSCIVHCQRKNQMYGFFLYANGAYVAELLTYKQLPRLTYNKSFQGYIPTIGQTVSMAEVTYGKEISQIEAYPGQGGSLVRSPGCSAVVLRSSEPDLVAIMLPSKEVRLVEKTSNCVFGRRAGVMSKYDALGNREIMLKLRPKAPMVHKRTVRVGEHQHAGGNGQKTLPPLRTDYTKLLMTAKTKFFLSPYTIRGAQYQKHAAVADIKAKTWGWKNRDPVYR